MAPRARPAQPATQGPAPAPARPAVPSPLPQHKRQVRFHDLRHTCASLLIANGASIMLVSQRLGHASTRMTLDRYSWMYPSEEAAMAVALDAVWEAAPRAWRRPAASAGAASRAGAVCGPKRTPVARESEEAVAAWRRVPEDD